MGFNGYWFNKIKQKYTTNKYPHCYVGIINKLGGLGTHWGKFDNILNKMSAKFGYTDNVLNKVTALFGHLIPVEYKDAIHFGYFDNIKNRISARFGSINDGGNNMVLTHTVNLDTTDFIVDTNTQGFKMAVEGAWHKLEPISLDNSYTLYDAELNPLDPTNYGIVIFYKIVVPAGLVNSSITTNDWITSRNKYGFQKAVNLGTPISIQDTDNFDALLIEHPTIAYALPSTLNQTSLPNSNFATGSSIASTFINKDNTLYVQAATPINTRPPKFLFYNSVLSNQTNFNDRQVRIVINKDAGTLSYSIITDGNGLNLPVGNYKDNRAKYLMPLLFKPMGLRTATLAEFANNNSENVKNLNAWIYCVLGVKEITS